MSKKTNRFRASIFAYAPVLFWMVLIFYLSSISGSGATYEMSKVMLLERKVAHVAEYFILTVLFVRVLLVHIPKNFVRVLWLSTFLTLIYAVSDETHQLFVFGRTGKIADVFIDGIGVVLAVIFIMSMPCFYKKLKYSSVVSRKRNYLPQKKKKPTI